VTRDESRTGQVAATPEEEVAAVVAALTLVLTAVPVNPGGDASAGAGGGAGAPAPLDVWRGERRRALRRLPRAD
jgi:hypothetical protein